jgi:hypothetical protein
LYATQIYYRNDMIVMLNAAISLRNRIMKCFPVSRISFLCWILLNFVQAIIIHTVYGLIVLNFESNYMLKMKTLLMKLHGSITILPYFLVSAFGNVCTNFTTLFIYLNRKLIKRVSEIVSDLAELTKEGENGIYQFERRYRLSALNDDLDEIIGLYIELHGLSQNIFRLLSLLFGGVMAMTFYSTVIEVNLWS